MCFTVSGLEIHSVNCPSISTFTLPYEIACFEIACYYGVLLRNRFCLALDTGPLKNEEQQVTFD